MGEIMFHLEGTSSITNETFEIAPSFFFFLSDIFIFLQVTNVLSEFGILLTESNRQFKGNN